MIRYSFLFLVLFLVGIFMSGFLFILKPETSVVPGWHTTIYPPFYVFELFAIFWLGIAALIYFILEKKRFVFNRRAFLFHAFLSLSIFINNPIRAYGFMLTSYDGYNAERVIVLLPYALFIIGQVIFIIAAVKFKQYNKV